MKSPSLPSGLVGVSKHPFLSFLSNVGLQVTNADRSMHEVVRAQPEMVAGEDGERGNNNVKGKIVTPPCMARLLRKKNLL